MQLNSQLQKMICDAYSEGQQRLFGTKCKDVEAIVYKNKIFIISENALNMKETSSRVTIRGRRIDIVLNEMKQIEYHIYMKSILLELTGSDVVSSQPNISLSNQLKMDIYCMGRDILDIS